ncbi:flagellar biosynthesis anti-sigma factor FlgM [uncultured Sphingomonas sp.]|uniref:flagellar biosynthesis anti-sigma factor FlgM n=1 Tax=uncultured Sphingomonas sp. TaxID=158754 RepID=UPI0025DA3A11|nr:flagellar biosynthesis anti-sigma factor FlgM [uncultured Sphingomonas sp.]
MITAVGPTGISRVIELRGDAVSRSEPVAKVATADTHAATTPKSPAAELAAQGAPVDTGKVAAIRAAIADGTYAIDPQAIAERMIALDLPERA